MSKLVFNTSVTLRQTPPSALETALRSRSEEEVALQLSKATDQDILVITEILIREFQVEITNKLNPPRSLSCDIRRLQQLTTELEQRGLTSKVLIPKDPKKTPQLEIFVYCLNPAEGKKLVEERVRHLRKGAHPLNPSERWAILAAIRLGLIAEEVVEAQLKPQRSKQRLAWLTQWGEEGMRKPEYLLPTNHLTKLDDKQMLSDIVLYLGVTAVVETWDVYSRLVNIYNRIGQEYDLYPELAQRILELIFIAELSNKQDPVEALSESKFPPHKLKLSARLLPYYTQLTKCIDTRIRAFEADPAYDKTGGLWVPKLQAVAKDLAEMKIKQARQAYAERDHNDPTGR